MNTIKVRSTTQHVVVNPVTKTFVIEKNGPVGPPGVQGPPGIQGPPGPSGSAAASYQHEQSTISNSWLVNHNLGFKPNVAIFDVSNVAIEASVIHHSDNQAEIQFLTPRAGTARFS